MTKGEFLIFSSFLCVSMVSFGQDCHHEYKVLSSLVENCNKWNAINQELDQKKTIEYDDINILATSTDGINYNFSYRVKTNNIDADVIVLQLNYKTGSSNIVETEKSKLLLFFRKYFTKQKINNYKSIEVIGHTDLETTKGSNYDDDNKCGEVVDKSSNDCLALIRAYKVYKELNLYFPNKEDKFLTYSFDEDFFIRNTDKKLSGTLLTILRDKKGVNIQDIAGKDKLDFNLSDNVKTIRKESRRKNSSINQKISNKNKMYRVLFKPFRSVVVIAHKKA